MGKYNIKRKQADLEIVPKAEEIIPLPAVRSSDDPIPKKPRWTNRQRVLVFCARGINHRDRHLLQDLKTLMPHHRTESKMERVKNLAIINEMCTMKHCNKAILFEGRRKRDLYMWMANTPEGPSAKFLVENISTMGELKLTGNCLKGSRPLLSFSNNFKDKPYLLLLKEMLTQTFGVPNHHPKSQPFVDHIYIFSFLDDRIWFRNFQILSEDGALVEIGPRFVLNPIKIFSDSFVGEILWENPDYVSPSKHRQMLKKKSKDRYLERVEQKAKQIITMPKTNYDLDDVNEVFKGDSIKMAKKLSEKDELKEKEKVTQIQQQEKEEIKAQQKKQRKLELLTKIQKPKRNPKKKRIIVEEQ